MTIDESSAYFISEFGLDCTKDYVIKRIEELVRREYEDNIPLKPHVPELLDHLDSKGIRYGVATATYRSLAEAVLRRCGICERFAFILTDAEYPTGKRRPDIFLGAAERLGTSPYETLVIEDSLHCLKTASDAGFVTAAVYDKAAETVAENNLLKTVEYSTIYQDGYLFIGLTEDNYKGIFFVWLDEEYGWSWIEVNI